MLSFPVVLIISSDSPPRLVTWRGFQFRRSSTSCADPCLHNFAGLNPHERCKASHGLVHLFEWYNEIEEKKKKSGFKSLIQYLLSNFSSKGWKKRMWAAIRYNVCMKSFRPTRKGQKAPKIDKTGINHAQSTSVQLFVSPSVQHSLLAFFLPVGSLVTRTTVPTPNSPACAFSTRIKNPASSRTGTHGQTRCLTSR